MHSLSDEELVYLSAWVTRTAADLAIDPLNKVSDQIEGVPDVVDLSLKGAPAGTTRAQMVLAMHRRLFAELGTIFTAMSIMDLSPDQKKDAINIMFNSLGKRGYLNGMADTEFVVEACHGEFDAWA